MATYAIKKTKFTSVPDARSNVRTTIKKYVRLPYRGR